MPGRSDSRTYGTVSAEKQKEMMGLVFVQGLADGTLPLNTIAKTSRSGRQRALARPWHHHLLDFRILITAQSATTSEYELALYTVASCCSPHAGSALWTRTCRDGQTPPVQEERPPMKIIDSQVHVY